MLTHFLSSRILPLAYLHCLPNNHDVNSLYENQDEVLYLKLKYTRIWILKEPGKIDNCSTTGALGSYGWCHYESTDKCWKPENVNFFSLKMCLNLKTNLGILWLSWNSLTCDDVITMTGMVLCPVISGKNMKGKRIWCGISLCMLWIQLVTKGLLWNYSKQDSASLGKLCWMLQ